VFGRLGLVKRQHLKLHGQDGRENEKQHTNPFNLQEEEKEGVDRRGRVETECVIVDKREQRCIGEKFTTDRICSGRGKRVLVLLLGKDMREETTLVTSGRPVQRGSSVTMKMRRRSIKRIVKAGLKRQNFAPHSRC